MSPTLPSFFLVTVDFLGTCFLAVGEDLDFFGEVFEGDLLLEADLFLPLWLSVSVLAFLARPRLPAAGFLATGFFAFALEIVVFEAIAFLIFDAGTETLFDLFPLFVFDTFEALFLAGTDTDFDFPAPEVFELLAILGAGLPTGFFLAATIAVTRVFSNHFKHSHFTQSVAI